MRFNQILIVDSIPAGEQNTAQVLYGDVVLRARLVEQPPTVRYLRVESAQEFLALLQELTRNAPQGTPVLHMECHGGEDGLWFGDHSSLSWAQLKPELTALNVATQMNLLVVVAACEGHAIARTLTTTDRAPLHGFIGPNRVVLPCELYRGFLAFYESLLATRSAGDALAALRNAVADTFVFRTAEWMFQYAWDHYQRTHETPQARRDRVRRMVANPPAWYDGPPVTEEEMLRQWIALDRPIFEEFRRTFFLIDIYPEHEGRFRVRYAPLSE